MRRIHLGALGAVFAVSATSALATTNYHFCISSDKRPGNVMVKSGPGPLDYGKEWYRVQVAQDYCYLYGASGCSVSDFDAAKCGSLPQESIEYKNIDGKQFQAIFSGNPAVMGQAVVEVVTGVPVAVITQGPQAVGKAANKVCKWFNPHC